MSNFKSSIRREKMVHKDTRWDRIRKRNSIESTNALKTDAVKRLIEKDFIGKQNQRLLNGEGAGLSLNPSIIMDIRHEMFKKIPRKLPLATVANENNLKSCKAHNIAIEEHFIANELNKFRQQLQKVHKKNYVKKRLEQTLKMDNTDLMKSLEKSSKHIEDFYAAPVEALHQVYDVCRQEVSLKESDKENLVDKDHNNEEDIINKTIVKYEEIMQHFPEMNENEKHICRTPSPLTETEELLKPMKAVGENHMLQIRCVRFEEEVEVCKFQRENSTCSNTSDGIDSVISDLAEEALYELKMEEEAKSKQQESLNNVEPIKETTENPTSDHSVTSVLTTATTTSNEESSDYMTPLVIKGTIAPSTFKNSLGQEGIEHISNSEDDESTLSCEQNKIIEQLFQARAHTNIYILRKYFLKWIHFTTIQKIERESDSRNDRVHLINVFLDKIRKEKVRLQKSKSRTGESTEENSETNGLQSHREKPKGLPIQAAKKYQNKIKTQQDIIDLQKLKLERQERLIMELKLNKLSDESKAARQEIKDELKSVIRFGDPKAKAKAKCLQLIGNLKDAQDEEFARLQGKALMMPKFLENMQERALERSIKHEQAKQRRLQKEAEREAQRIALEEAKRLEDEEAKRLRIELLKEKRRQEKMAKIIKERERQRAIENYNKSKEFCRKLLLRRVGMEGFKRLLQRKRDNQRKCELHRKNIFKRNYFTIWKDYYIMMNNRKNQKAEDFYFKILKRNIWARWQRYLAEEQSKYCVAVDWFELKLSEFTFLKWWGYVKKQKMIEETKMRQANSHHNWHLKWKVLDCWQRLPQILQLEKETEERRQRWRMKIWELLPDYTPNRDDFI